MIVTKNDFDHVLAHFKKPGQYALDTETTGLRHKDRLFSIIIGDNLNSYYFNFHSYTDLPDDLMLPKKWLIQFQSIFDTKDTTWFMHNAKFDLRMLMKEGLTVKGIIHCTEALARIQKNNHLSYSLDECSKRIGMKKDDKVEEYISKHKLYDLEDVPDKKKKFKAKHFEKVPFEIIVPYGEMDVETTLALGTDQISYFNKNKSLWRVAENEIKLTPVCAQMEQYGMKIDKEYTQKALDYEYEQLVLSRREYVDLTGEEFLDSAKHFSIVFNKLGQSPPGFTEKGNPSFAKDLLDALDTKLGKMIIKVRHHNKMIGTYYSSFLYFSDENGIIRPNMRQGGTEPGRFSYSDPNIQNVPKEDEEEDFKKIYLVRSCFIPRKDYCFGMIDYDQQEFRMMLDYAGEMKLIHEINAGADVHQATADMLGIPRKQAKTINFGLLYGMGIAKLAKALKISLAEAIELKAMYFGKLPRVKSFLKEVKRIGEDRNYIYNWFGRRCYIAQKDWAYILPNHLIQGGGADLIKKAMVEISPFQDKHKFKMVAQIHDELLFEFHKDYLDIVPKLSKIMSNLYEPKNGMQLTCSVEHSWKSWGSRDKIKGYPNAA